MVILCLCTRNKRSAISIMLEAKILIIFWKHVRLGASSYKRMKTRCVLRREIRLVCVNNS